MQNICYHCAKNQITKNFQMIQKYLSLGWDRDRLMDKKNSQRNHIDRKTRTITPDLKPNLEVDLS